VGSGKLENTRAVPRFPPNRIFHKIEFFLFRLALLIVFIVGLVRLVRLELGW
jgi:hypothetical protein